MVATLVVVALWLGAVALITYHQRLASWWRGEIDLNGAWRFEPRHPVDEAALAALPHDEIHGELLPRWVTASSHFLDDPSYEVETYEALRRAVAPDPNLAYLLDEQRRIILDGRILAEAERLHYLVWAWNRYIDEAGLPYLLEGNVGVSRSRRAFFYLTSYRTCSDLSLMVGDQRCRVRLVNRVDRVNVRELHLGGINDPDDGAVVVIDRLQEFALNAVWPLLAGEDQFPPGTMMATYAGPVSREVEAGIGSERFAVLRRTARWRARFLEVIHAVAEREPCSGFAIIHTPYDGFERPGLDELVLRTALSLGAPCPQVKIEEIIILHKGTRELRREPGLREAIAALLAWLARVVATHEARHLADLDADGDLRVECDDCGPPGVSAEVSAYLASFAWSDGPATAYYQACRAVTSERNPHAAAMEAINRWLDVECFQGPPEGLPRRARELESRHFGRSQAISLPESFPGRLPVSRGAGRRHQVVGPSDEGPR